MCHIRPPASARPNRPATALAAISVLAAAASATACPGHWATGVSQFANSAATTPTPRSSFATADDAARAAAAMLRAQDVTNSRAAGSALKTLLSDGGPAPSSFTTPTAHPAAPPTFASVDAIASFKINYNGATAHSPNATLNSHISTNKTDVTGVWFDSNYLYVTTNDNPSYDIGRADGNNPAYSRATNQTLRITRNPTPNTGTLTSPGNGQVAVAVNGSAFFDAGDAQTYNNAGTWRRIANSFESSTFDVGPGHSAPQGAPSNNTAGTYHYHVGPTGLLAQIDAGNTGTRHSPIIGFAFDGFPIYGPYAYTDPTDPTSAIKLLTSSYKVRTDLVATGSLRNSLTTGGTILTGTAVGPAVSTTYPSGCFKEDYNYLAGSGDLNNFNMRYSITPEYPTGTWAYYMTTDSLGNFTYPYILGPQYFGVVPTGAGGNVTVPGTATKLLAGDTNFDGVVNYTDLLAFLRGYGHTGTVLWSMGDFDSNIAIDDDDLALLQANYTPNAGSTFAADLARALSLVPEPSALTVVGGMITVTAIRRRSQTSQR